MEVSTKMLLDGGKEADKKEDDDVQELGVWSIEQIYESSGSIATMMERWCVNGHSSSK